jgi:hypothetical protein
MMVISRIYTAVQYVRPPKKKKRKKKKGIGVYRLPVPVIRIKEGYSERREEQSSNAGGMVMARIS